jgi:hypothetical protein
VQVGDLVTITPPQMVDDWLAGAQRVTGIVIKIEGGVCDDGPIDSIVSVLTSLGILDVTWRCITLRDGETREAG